VADQKWTKEFLEKQVVPGTHAYQCPYCGEITRKQKELKDHLLRSCRRVPSINLPSKSSATVHSQSSSDDAVRCQRCGHVMKQHELAGHMKEFHPLMSVADQPVRSNASPIQIRDHDREVLRIRAQQLEAELSISHGGMKSEPAKPEGHMPRGVPCSCGGSNENCCRCFGVGVIGGNRPSKSVYLYEYVPPNRKRCPRPIVPAQKVEHRIEHVETKSRRTSNGPVQCLICRELVRTTILGLHYSARHSGNKKLLRRKDLGQWVNCPVCNTVVKRLQKHMRRHEQKAVGRGAAVAKLPSANY
jgi:uncharacterized C2H2 Zn-finger protein